MVDVCSMVPPENANPSLLRQLAVVPEQSAEVMEKEEEETQANIEEKIKGPVEEAAAKEEEKERQADEGEKKEEVKETAAKEEEQEDIKEEVAKEVKAEMAAKEGEGEQGEEDKKAAAPVALSGKAKCVDCEGLEGFDEEEGCGPLCKLENLVGKLKA
mmetsp:Transcript_68741/g.100634  ORF Transcript_68741/g.100634 Transcript_68741/m.100634 type:complete len:158 (+) Transcript_68741:95-568(+)